MANYDQLEEAVNLIGNVVRYDDLGMPSVMVPVPKFDLNELVSSWPATPHPAFIVNGKIAPVIYVSKYENVIRNERAYSLPMVMPGLGGGYSLDFYKAKAACAAKGDGWHMMSNAEWAAIALWCKKNGTMPRGNNTMGRDYDAPLEKAPIAHLMPSPWNYAFCYTGSGPASWSHNGQISGIYDLNGNTSEFVSGYRTLNGEIQVIPDNNSAANVDEGDQSTLWRAILSNGNLVDPGTSGTLKWDYTAAVTGSDQYAFRLNTTIINAQSSKVAMGAMSFSTLTAYTGVTIPNLLRFLALYPQDATDHGSDYMYMRNFTNATSPRVTMYPTRGGGNVLSSLYPTFGQRAGVFNVTCIHEPNINSPALYGEIDTSFRVCYIDMTTLQDP